MCPSSGWQDVNNLWTGRRDAACGVFAVCHVVHAHIFGASLPRLCCLAATATPSCFVGATKGCKPHSGDLGDSLRSPQVTARTF